jgi:DNA adenine methylase
VNTATDAPTRPALRWHGGKWLLAPWIIQHFPPHRVYVEPFGGAASVLLRKRRCTGEVYNDLDGEAVNLFRVLRSPRAVELIEAIRLTPFAREELERARMPADDDVERARLLVVRSFMGFGSDGHNPAIKTGFRANSNRSHTTPAVDWANLPEALVLIAERLRGVTIERREAMEVMAAHDGANTLHYVDPPYLPETRSNKSRRWGGGYHAYTHEMDDADHAELLAFLPTLNGAVVLSGYHSELYEEALEGWARVERAAMADGARSRTEVLWLNEAAVAAGAQQPLFREAG